MPNIKIKPAHMANVGIVHDWFPVIAGGERVVQEIAAAHPNNKIYSLFDFLSDEDRRELFGDSTINVSRLNSLPFVEKYYRYLLLPSMRAIEEFDMTEHDVVISSSAALAKGVITRPGQAHIAYIHSPARYAWDLTHEYIASLDGVLGGLKRHMAREMMHKFRIWDMRTPASIDVMVANSKFIQKRIKKVYGRDSTVIYPPVNTDAFTLATQPKEGFYLTASRMVPYKKIDLIVRAFSAMPDKKLVVIGDGPDMQLIKSQAGPNVEILGYQSFEVLRDHMQRAKAFVFAAQEDFGIVPVEAQACGTPVIALDHGGTAETIRRIDAPSPTGVHFSHQTETDIIEALKTFEVHEHKIDPQDCRNNAIGFGADRFRNEIQNLVSKQL